MYHDKKKTRNISSPKWKNDKKTNFNIIEFYSYTFFAYNCKLNILIFVYRNKISPWHVGHFQTSSTLKYIGVYLSKKGINTYICEWQAINVFNT